MKYNSIQGLFERITRTDIQKKVFAQIIDTKYTYRQFLEGVHKLNSLFQSRNLKKGDRVILSTSDDYYTALFFIAFLRYGIVTIFLDPEVPEKQAKALIKKADAQGYVMDDPLFESRNVIDSSNQFQLRVKKNLQKKGKLFNRLLKRKTEANAAEPNTFPAILASIGEKEITIPSIAFSDLAYVLFTSGTTSEPKGVMITYENLFAQLHTLSKVYELTNQSRLHNILPLYHVDGIIQGPLLALYNEGTWLRPMRFDQSKINDLFHSFYKYRASHFFCVPLILSFMDKYSENYEDSFLTEDFKYIISSASKLDEKLWIDIERKFKVTILNVYGMTETVAAALYCASGDHPRKVGTVGIPIDCEAKITNSEGAVVKENEAGILWIKGANVFNGYFKNPDATSKAIQDGWINTGDIASVDEDGFFKITGRIRNMVISGGVNIYPEQVSEMINSHPDVIESCCIGISDEHIGEKLVSAVVVSPNASLNKSDLLSFLRPLLKSNQIPKDIFFFNALPKGKSGKIQTNQIEKQIENLKNDTQKTFSTGHQESIKTAASEAFGIAIDMLSMDDTAQSIDGWDSMAHLMFITILEKRFNIRFATSEMMNMTSLRTSERILKKKLDDR
ncbi:MAG: AMP-binding protein [Saprospiraceae bacterium]|nr:AMP-binding protein [Saprospiraceae bacterium]